MTQMINKEPEPKGLLSTDNMWILKEEHGFLQVYGRKFETLNPRVGGAALPGILTYNLTHSINYSNRGHGAADHYCFAQTSDETFVVHMKNKFLSHFKLPKRPEQSNILPKKINTHQLDGFEESAPCVAMCPVKAAAEIFILTSSRLLHLEFKPRSQKPAQTEIVGFPTGNINVGYFFDEGRGLMINRRGISNDITSWRISQEKALLPSPMELVGRDLSLEWVHATGTRFVYSSQSNINAVETYPSEFRTLHYVAKAEQLGIQAFATPYVKILKVRFLENDSPYFLVKGLHSGTPNSISGYRTCCLGTVYPANEPLVPLPGLKSAWVFPSELAGGAEVYVKQWYTLALLDLRRQKTHS